MRHFLASLWWWIRVIVLVVVGLYALALLWNNSKQSASLWYWPGRPVEETSVIALALAAFLSGGLIMTIGWALGTAMVNLRRTQAARRKRAAEMQREEIERKASMLRVKPAPAPIVRPRVEPKAEPTPTKPEPVPQTAAAVVVEPIPEATGAPSPVVVIKQEKPRPFADKPIVEKQPAVDAKAVESRVLETPVDVAAIDKPPAPIVVETPAGVIVTPSIESRANQSRADSNGTRNEVREERSNGGVAKEPGSAR